MIDRYDWPGGAEALWRFGPHTGPVVAWALPPFEEGNRTRTFVVGMARALAAEGIGSLLPDLPGQGESLLPTGAATLSAWRAAFAAACATATGPVVAASLRSGALVVDEAPVAGRWQLAPQSGSALVRELHRIGGGPDDQALVERAGNAIARRLLDELATAEPVAAHPVRIVRLGSDPAAADLRIDAAPLWRRAEPGDDSVPAAGLVADLAAWTRACAGC